MTWTPLKGRIVAELTGNQVVMAYSDDAPSRAVVYKIHNFSTTDTVDLSNQFSVVKSAVFQATSVNVKGVCQVAGTVVTIPTAGLAGEAGYLLVVGSSSGT